MGITSTVWISVGMFEGATTSSFGVIITRFLDDVCLDLRFAGVPIP